MPDDELLLKEGGCHKQDDGMECKWVLVVVLDEKRLVKPGRAPADEQRSCFPPKQEALGERYQGSLHLHVSK